MTVTDPRTAAIEAATVALHDFDCDPDCREDLTTMGRYGRQAAAAYDAMAEPIRAGERAAAFDEIAIGLTIYAGMQPDVEAGIFRRAAQLVREIGSKR